MYKYKNKNKNKRKYKLGIKYNNKQSKQIVGVPKARTSRIYTKSFWV